jgi:BirA family biotin operon repressor/biotin-[acetyl-CoA-carboxylase] ligase
VVSVLQERLPEAWLKWPNDILVGERKVGGILCERLEGVDGLADALIVGIGLNLRTPPSGWPPELEGRATSIQDEIEGGVPAELRRAALLESILERFLVLEKALVDAGPAALMHQYRRLMAPLIGREVSVQKAGKGVAARVLGVRDNGALEVQDGTGASWAVVAGDVHLGSI